MKKLKRIFAAFAAAAVSVSMLAFTGCDLTGNNANDNNNPGITDTDNKGDNNNPGGSDNTPGGSDNTPGGDDNTPGGDDNTPGGDDNTPGDDDDNTPGNNEGIIEGNYIELKPNEAAAIIGNVDINGIFGDLEADDASLSLGVNTKLSGSFVIENVMNVSGSVALDYKFNASESGMAGMGNMTLSAEYKTAEMTDKQSLAFTGEAYTTANQNGGFIYASADIGKVKINLKTLMEAIIGNGGDDNIGGGDIIVSPASLYEAESGMDIATILAMADQLGVKIAVDVTEGLKVRISIVEDTIWAGLMLGLQSSGMQDAQVAELMEVITGYVTFNTFKFDLYFALDADGEFAGASVVTDIDVKVNSGILSLFPDNDPTPTDEAGDTELPAFDMDITLNGSVIIYTHDETIEVPSTVTESTEYVDMTNEIIEIIGNMMQ